MAIEKENMDVASILVVGVVSVVLTVASVIGVQALYFNYDGFQTDEKVIKAPTADAASKIAEQDAKLLSYGWANREQGQVIIPIEQAMKLTLRKYQSAGGSSSETTPNDSADAPSTERGQSDT